MKVPRIVLLTCMIVALSSHQDILAEDANGPIPNEEAIFIEASPKTISHQPGSPVLEIPSSVALELPGTIMGYSTPYQLIPNSTSLGSIEFSSKPKWITPKGICTIIDAKIDPKTIQSFDAHAKGMTYCSWITRNNLQRLTKLEDRDSVKGFDGKGVLIGDAITIIEQGKRTNIFKEVYLTDGSIIKYLNREYRHTKATIFDIYIHHTKVENKFFAGHRITAFLGTDNAWYILDPVMMHHQNPLLLQEYFTKYGKPDQDRIYILKTGYAPAGYAIEPYPILSVKYFSELKPLIQTEDVVIETTGNETKIAFNTDIRFLGEYTFLDIAAGTIMTLSGSITDSFSLVGAKEQEQYPIALPWRVRGANGMDIHYSQPVKITLLTDLAHDMPFTPLMLDDLGNMSKSITNDKYASCDEQGDVLTPESNQGGYRIQERHASFYSCYGGSFSILPGIGMTVEVSADGSSPYNEHSYNGILYQGQDSSGNNGIVRVGDVVSYQVSILGTKLLQQDLSLDIHISSVSGESILGSFESLPTECISSGSYLSGNNSILHCLLAKNLVQDTLVLPLSVRISQDASNNASISLLVIPNLSLKGIISETKKDLKNSGELNNNEFGIVPFGYQNGIRTDFNNVFLSQESPSVLITNFFDNKVFTKITETVKESSVQLIAGIRDLIIP